MILEKVVDTVHQRILRSHHQHIDFFSFDKAGNAFEVVDAEGHVFAHLSGTGITRCDKQFFDFVALSDFPSQGVLTAAAS